jgi:hypothetical protein
LVLTYRACGLGQHDHFCPQTNRRKEFKMSLMEFGFAMAELLLGARSKRRSAKKLGAKWMIVGEGGRHLDNVISAIWRARASYAAFFSA